MSYFLEYSVAWLLMLKNGNVDASSDYRSGLTFHAKFSFVWQAVLVRVETNFLVFESFPMIGDDCLVSQSYSKCKFFLCLA